MHGLTWPKISKIIKIKQVRATFGLILNSRYVCNPEKGAAITFIFSYVNPYPLSPCPVIMKTVNLATMLRHGCSRVLNTFPRHNRVPEPISNLWFTCQKHRPVFFKKYKDTFSYLYRDPKTRTKLGGDSKIPTWPIFLFFKNTSPKFPSISKTI